VHVNLPVICINNGCPFRSLSPIGSSLSCMYVTCNMAIWDSKHQVGSSPLFGYLNPSMFQHRLATVQLATQLSRFSLFVGLLHAYMRLATDGNLIFDSRKSTMVFCYRCLCFYTPRRQWASRSPMATEST
jgi:hypothetical protein